MCRLLKLSSRRSVSIEGAHLQLANYFFDTPVAQDRVRRSADLTGLKVWPTALKLLKEVSSSHLPKLLAKAATHKRPLRVIELGSGTGVLGLGVALLSGPSSHIVLTDPNLPVNFTESESGSSLEWLQVNADLNREATDAAGARVEVQELEWSNAEHRANLLAREGASFDLVLGSELLYDPDQYRPLLQVITELSAHPDTLTILGYTLRHGAEARFVTGAEDRFERVETRHFERSAASPVEWQLTTLSGGLKS